jgi:hypothetical protein
MMARVVEIARRVALAGPLDQLADRAVVECERQRS